MQLFTIGPYDDGPDALRNEVRNALHGLEPKLLVLYLPIDADHDAYLRALSTTHPSWAARPEEARSPSGA